MTIPVADAFLQYRTDGQIKFGGHLDYEVSDFGLHAGIDGWINPPTEFSVDGKARVCLGDLGCAGGEVVVSSIGLAACAYTDVVDFGAGYKWGPTALWGPALLANIDIMWHSCSVSGYQPAGAAAAGARATAVAAGVPRSFTVRSGLPSMVVAGVGDSAPPHVVLTGPGHVRMVSARTGPVRSSRGLIFHVPSRKTTFFVVKHPAAGRWQITPLADSSRLIRAGHGDGLPVPSIHGRVTGHGATRTFAYHVKPLPGQTVSFEEHGRSGSGFLGRARHASGRIRFTPAYGSRETRTIVAVVNSFGKPRGQYRVTAYRSPGPQTPARPAGFTITRKGTQLRLKWKRAPAVTHYIVKVRLSDGRVLLLLPTARQTAVTVKGIARKLTVAATLQVQSPLGIIGHAATARLGHRKRR